MVAAAAARSDGIVLTADLRLLGISLAAAQRMRRRGVLVAVGRGVDRLRDHPFDFRSRCRAALGLAGPSAVLGLRTAARLHGCWAYRDADVVEVVIARGRDHRTAVGRVVQTRWLPPAHMTVMDGLPVTTIARTFFDLCGDPDAGLSLRHPYHERRMKQLYNDCLGRRGMTFTMEAAVLSVLARRGRRGTRLVRRLLRYYGPRHEATRSDVETLFLELVRAYDLPDPECQAVISGPDGFVGTVDFAWRPTKVIVEVDSSWHAGPLDRAADQERDRRLRAAGYLVLRYRFGHITLEPERLARELGAAIDGNPSVAAPGTVGV